MSFFVVDLPFLGPEFGAQHWIFLVLVSPEAIPGLVIVVSSSSVGGS